MGNLQKQHIYQWNCNCGCPSHVGLAYGFEDYEAAYQACQFTSVRVSILYGSWNNGNSEAALDSGGSFKGNCGRAKLVLAGSVTQNNGVSSEKGSRDCNSISLICGFVILKAICQAHSIESGSIKVICDNINTLRVFEPAFVPEPTAESFDLVTSLYSLAKELPLTYLHN